MADKEKEEEETEDEIKTREAREEEFQERRNKFSKMEDEREKLRGSIREKYNIKKKEEENLFPIADMSHLMKKKPGGDEDEGFDPAKMGANVLGKVTGLFGAIPFPWK